MPSDSKAPTAKSLAAFDPSVLDQLACPACMGTLRLDDTGLLCDACGRVYPIVDGIPVLITGREEISQT